MPLWGWILLAGVGAVAALIGVVIGIAIRKSIGERKIGSAEREARKIKEDAAKEAESMRKEALISAKEDILRQRNEAEKELIELVNNDENSIEYAVSLINLYIKQKKYIKARKILKNYIKTFKMVL